MKISLDTMKKLMAILRDLDNVASSVQIHNCFEKDHGFLAFAKLHVYLNRAEEEGLVSSKLKSGGPERGFKDYREWSLTGHGLAVANERE